MPEREGGALGRLIDGFSHEEKKSPSLSTAGVLAPLLDAKSPRSVMITSTPGYLTPVSVLGHSIDELERILLRIGGHTATELLFVFRGGIRHVFRLWILAGESSGTAMALEVFSS